MLKQIAGLFKKPKTHKQFPEPPIDLKHWLLSPDKAKELQEIINRPVFKQACALLKEEAGPNTSAALSADPTINSNLHCWYSGYRDFHSDLAKLAHPKQAKPEQTNSEWMHIQNNQ